MYLKTGKKTKLIPEVFIERQKMLAEEDYALLFYIHGSKLEKHCNEQLKTTSEQSMKVYWNTVKLIYYTNNYGEPLEK